jgi:hypothetical protein
VKPRRKNWFLRQEQLRTGATASCRKRIDGPQACPRVSIVVAEIGSAVAAQRSAKSAHFPSGVALRVGGSSARCGKSRKASKDIGRARRATWRLNRRTNPSHVVDGTSQGVSPGSTNVRKLERLPKEGTSDRPCIDTLHGVAVNTVSASSSRLVRSPVRAARERRSGDRGVRS